MLVKSLVFKKLDCDVGILTIKGEKNNNKSINIENTFPRLLYKEKILQKAENISKGKIFKACLHIGKAEKLSAPALAKIIKYIAIPDNNNKIKLLSITFFDNIVVINIINIGINI